MFVCLLSIAVKTDIYNCPAVVLSQEQESQVEKGACAQGSGLLTHPCLKKKRLHIVVLRPLQDGDCYSDSKQRALVRRYTRRYALIQRLKLTWRQRTHRRIYPGLTGYKAMTRRAEVLSSGHSRSARLQGLAALQSVTPKP